MSNRFRELFDNPEKGADERVRKRAENAEAMVSLLSKEEIARRRDIMDEKVIMVIALRRSHCSEGSSRPRNSLQKGNIIKPIYITPGSSGLTHTTTNTKAISQSSNCE